jgi:hypothetical protein
MSRAALLALLVPWSAWAESPRGSEVVLVKRAGVTAYEEVSEEFGERCRVRAKVISFGDEGFERHRARVGSGEVLVTVGQEALDSVRGMDMQRIIPTLAFHTPPGMLGPPASPPPELILRVLTTARSSVKVVGVVYGPRSEQQIEAARRAGAKLGITLVTTRTGDGPAALRALVKMADKVHAIWLPGDTDVITPQVFQYALRLQLERGIPVAAATRQQVHSGALLAVDFNPRAAGRAAANIANRVLEGRPVEEHSDVELYGGARISVNATGGRRMGVDLAALARMGAKLE